MSAHEDPRVVEALAHALRSPSSATRRRAVALLARVDCAARKRWLDAALADPDSGVREMATIVTAWVCGAGDAGWPGPENRAQADRASRDDPAS